MKLKSVVASLMVLGLANSGIAAQGKSIQSGVDAQAIIDQNSSSIIKNVDGKWLDRISVGGRASGVVVYGNHDYPGAFTDLGHSSDLYLNNVNLIVNATLNDWVKVNTNIKYNGQPKYYAKYMGKGFYRVTDNDLTLDEGYVTIANFAKTPFYAQVGKKYLPFGNYSETDVPEALMPLTQKVAQISQPAVIAGFVASNGLYANAYALRGEVNPVDTDTGNIRNFGASVGYHNNLAALNLADMSYNVHFGWIRNILDTDNVSRSFVYYPYFAANPVGGIAAHADFSYNKIGFAANFVKALQNIIPEPGSDSHFWAADATADYKFKTLNHDSKVGLSYQLSGNGQAFNEAFTFNNNLKYMPHSRWVADYRVNLVKSVDADFALVHNRSYSNVAGLSAGTHTSNVALARLLVNL